MGKFLHHFKVMLWRNFLLKKRMKSKTISEFFMPIIMIACAVSIRAGNKPTVYKAQKYPVGNATLDDYKWKLMRVGVAPETERVKSLMNSIEQKLLGLLTIEWFSSEEEMNNYYMVNSSDSLIGIIFTADPYQNSSYILRFPSGSVPSTGVGIGKTGDCRTVDAKPFQSLEANCPALRYYYSGFVLLQKLIDNSIIQEENGTYIPQETTKIHLYPKDEYIDVSSTMKGVIPLYLMLAFAPLISVLAMLIVEEKEKKIKEGMLMMGLDVLAYWSAWFVIEAGMILALSVIMTGLIKVIDLFPNTNHVIIFIIILLFGMSIIMLVFMLTPFFNSAKVAGSAVGLGAVFLSLFYLLAAFLKDKINSVAFYFLAVLSPTAYTLGIENVIAFDVTGEMSWNQLFSGKFPIGSAMIMLIVDTILYGLLAYYFDSVIPGEFGTRRKPWFCLLPSFWHSKKSESTGNIVPDFSLASDSHLGQDIESVPEELKGKEAIRILNIAKTFKGRDGTTVKAVDGINLSIYEDHITALLGHNGAGKTTLISMLVGTLAPTSGTAYMYGEDISDVENIVKTRSITGVCLQENILLNELSCEEHLMFFAKLKGVPAHRLNSEVEQTLRDVDVISCRNTPSKKLSGGNKRKLCVGIALIGDPKIVYLDEPTSGVDPYSRRLLWTYLQQKKKNKVIVLTTHSMDEADILADRKAIITKGKLKCAGSSLFLKNKFGVGYHLNLTVSTSASHDDIQNLVLSTIDTAKFSKETSLELSFVLPLEETNKFPALFSNIEHAISHNQFGITNYAVSMTTLEEVFLSLAEEDEEEENESSNNYHLAQDTLHLFDSSLEDYSKSKVSASYMQGFLAFLKVQFILFLRQPAHIFPIIVIPLISVVVSYFLIKNSDTPSSTDLLQLSPKLYDDFPFKLYGNNSAFQFHQIYDALKDELGNVTSLNGTPDYDNLLTSCMATTIERPTKPKQIMWSGLFNDTCEHSLPILQNIMSNALLKVYSKLNKRISIATHPVPQKNGPKFNPLVFSWTMSIAILLPYMSSLISVDVVEDRENKVKNQLRVSGLNFHAYWAGVLVSHSTVFLLSLTIMVILLICLKVPFFDSSSLTATCILLVLHVPSSLLCCYVLSHMFNKHETAKAILPSICAVPAFIIILPVIILDMMGDSSLASILHYVFCVLSPFYAPAGGLYFITKVSMVSAIGTGTEDSVFSWKNNLPGTYLIMALQIILYYILLRVVEVLKSGGEISDAIFLKSKSSSFQQCSVPDPEEEDEDVKAERRRINANCSLSNQSIVMLDQVRKVYSPLLKCRKHVDKVAVKNISLGIDSGNIFGLLGPNGAGKTTTARMITAEEAPTCGQVYVAGMKVKSSLSSAFTEMGYCPQEDALWKLLTVEEHLHLFAAIKGVPKSRIDSLCKELIDWLHIGEHAKKKAKTISGGTKRKMCFIMSILGMPKAVLLDEPSTGLDPQAKRHLWNLICSMFPPKGQHSVILTTHSMEEADALCTRVGIMVKGVMRCLGSTQHLKNKYGIGYTLDLKVGRNDSGSTFANEVKAYIKDKFPAAEVKEEFEDRITFSVPQSVTSLANVFSCLEEAKSLYNIEEYSFSQTTLEQVFLGFAKEQEENDTTVTF